MTDTVSKEKRSETMRAVRSRDTKPEMIVRRLLHRNGYRYRLHTSSLPGKPDLAFSSKKKAVFIHGCFWHGCPKHLRIPHTNTEFWTAKIEGNRARDLQHLKSLTQLGWKVLILWECELGNESALIKRLTRFLR